MTTAMVTGALGFCGRHLVQRLRQERDINIVGLDVRPEPNDGGILDRYTCVDTRNVHQLAQIVREVRPDWVFHLAGLIAGPMRALYEVNFLGGINVLESLREHAPHARVVSVGTAAEYGYQSASAMPLHEDSQCTPEGAYAISKYAFTLAGLDYARRHELGVVVARPFNIIGAGVPPSVLVGAVIERIRQALRDPEQSEIAVGNMNTQRDYIGVEQLVDAYVHLAKGDFRGQVFNICSGQPVAVTTVLEILLSFAPRPITVKSSSALMRQTDPPAVYGDWSKANKCFGFTPNFNLREALWAAWQHAMEY